MTNSARIVTGPAKSTLVISRHSGLIQVDITDSEIRQLLTSASKAVEYLDANRPIITPATVSQDSTQSVTAISLLPAVDRVQNANPKVSWKWDVNSNGQIVGKAQHKGYRLVAIIADDSTISMSKRPLGIIGAEQAQLTIADLVTDTI